MELRRNIYIKLLAWKKENTGRVLELQGPDRLERHTY